jgi:hypothetical protein
MSDLRCRRSGHAPLKRQRTRDWDAKYGRELIDSGSSRAVPRACAMRGLAFISHGSRTQFMSALLSLASIKLNPPGKFSPRTVASTPLSRPRQLVRYMAATVYIVRATRRRHNQRSGKSPAAVKTPSAFQKHRRQSGEGPARIDRGSARRSSTPCLWSRGWSLQDDPRVCALCAPQSGDVSEPHHL